MWSNLEVSKCFRPYSHCLLELDVSSDNMSGLLFENNKHVIAKVRENANRHGGKNATITK